MKYSKYHAVPIIGLNKYVESKFGYITQIHQNIIMINIIKLSQCGRILRHCLKFQRLLYSPCMSFTLNNKKAQLILYTENEVQKLHVKKQNKQKKWKSVSEQKSIQIKVSLLGLPNSGKSSLFNCLIGQNLAIVDNQPGMTRDRRQFQIMDNLVKIIDTPGIQIPTSTKHLHTTIKHDIFKQTMTAVHQSNIIIVVIDSKKPITNQQIQMIKYLRKFSKHQNLVIACNKSEKMLDESQYMQELARMGVEENFFCSALTGEGVFQILNYIDKSIPNQMKQKLKQLKRERVDKFQLLVNKLKQQMKQLQGKGMNIKQWEQDFRKINPNPQLNEDLDHENFQHFFTKPQSTFSSTRGVDIKNLKVKNTIKICFIGRPNVGKSSLINQILQENRLTVQDTAHTTRDCISNKIMYKDRKIELIDTAGLNNHILDKTQEQYIKKAQISTMLHIKQSNVVVYVMDAYSAFKIQDFKLIRNVVEEGRPIIIAVNKWEAIKQQYKYKAKNYLLQQIDKNLGHTVHGHPIVFVSAKMNDGIDTMIDTIITAYDKWNSRISTGMLNNWLDKFKKLDNLPKDNQMTLKINYMLQAKVRPPHFVFFVNNKKIFKDNYLRFVQKNLAKQFKMDGIPFRITLRSTNNNQNKQKSSRKQNKQPSIKSESSIKKKMQQLKKKYSNFGL